MTGIFRPKANLKRMCPSRSELYHFYKRLQARVSYDFTSSGGVRFAGIEVRNAFVSGYERKTQHPCGFDGKIRKFVIKSQDRAVSIFRQ